jgi:hypothetical protein
MYLRVRVLTPFLYYWVKYVVPMLLGPSVRQAVCQKFVVVVVILLGIALCINAIIVAVAVVRVVFVL